ncbi:MAG: protein translocase SEC61 complex subunit gamma [Candidatus Nanohaloarchaea archaeon]
MDFNDVRQKALETKRNVKSKLREYIRVLKIAEKPDRDEYEMAAKITGAGIIIIGFVGFLFFMASTILQGAFS